MYRFKLILAVSAMLSLLGCGQQKEVSSEVKVSENGVKTKVSYLKREALQPYEKYTQFKILRHWEIGSQDHKNNDLAFRNFYWSSAPINYELLAYDFLDGYADEPDAFKKKDMINSNKDKLDNIYQNFPKNKYFAIEDNSNINHAKYNEEKKGFEINMDGREGFNGQVLYEIAMTEKSEKNRSSASRIYYSWTTLGGRNTETNDWTKTTSFVYIPKNEEEARMIESELSDPQSEKNITHVLLGRTIDATFFDSQKAYASIFMIDGIALVNNKTGKVIFTISKNELGEKYEIQCEYTEKMLGLEETPKQMGSNYRAKICGGY